jgi:pimeloyl-ACP methyl ester carboxylesterase
MADNMARNMAHNMANNGLKYLSVGEGAEQRAIAVRARDGAAPGLLWLGGYKSDMHGTKAQALAGWAAQQRRACVRFDYSGHGESGGAFTDGTIGRWLAETLAVFEACCRGPQIVIGSSMGGWLALLLARALRARKEASGSRPRSNVSSRKRACGRGRHNMRRSPIS